jgi:hypothetical protein
MLFQYHHHAVAKPTAMMDRDSGPSANRSELLLAASAVSWALWWCIAWLGSAVLLGLRKRGRPHEIDRDL